MDVTINGCRLNVEVLGPDDGPVLIAHHGGGGIGSLAEPKATFGPLADRFRVVVFDARGNLYRTQQTDPNQPLPQPHHRHDQGGDGHDVRVHRRA